MVITGFLRRLYVNLNVAAYSSYMIERRIASLEANLRTDERRAARDALEDLFWYLHPHIYFEDPDERHVGLELLALESVDDLKLCEHILKCAEALSKLAEGKASGKD